MRKDYKMNMTFGKLIGGVAIFIAVVIFSLKEATADTVQDNCVNAGNVAMKVAEFRDINIPLEMVVGKLIEAGLPKEMAVRLSVWVYSTPQADRATIGRWFYTFCMKEAGEAL
jgi:TctA family transporter